MSEMPSLLSMIFAEKSDTNFRDHAHAGRGVAKGCDVGSQASADYARRRFSNAKPVSKPPPEEHVK
ncbi:hypothetical protein RFM26_07695 [Mesorhizobium sp. VK23B]|uniref:Uncharacterized protein n=1 Tax=Mesorhizobium dulcispinae TaxID=3072316 RepID=A0ABU4XA09_9HYPH|nr:MULTISPECIES: hypothetical protein [unclassified Mesorhizobium]MDX8465566.1 hypothetical protein [Mesorhizobium sp. VK23B]MDX8471632.1 hypothetical protein [Mesorhizobium sp. VK23A]